MKKFKKCFCFLLCIAIIVSTTRAWTMNNEFIAVQKNDNLVESQSTVKPTEPDITNYVTEELPTEETEELSTGETEELSTEEVESASTEFLEATETETIEQTEEPEEIVSGNSITLDSYGRPINPYLRAAITKGNVTYTYSGGTLTITGNGTVTNGWQSYDTAWAGCVEKVTKVVFNSVEITSVNTDAFEGCSKLTTVNITACGWSNTGSTIACFRGVETIKTVTVGKLGNLNNYMFQGCSGITAVTIADGGITCIPAYCFDMCTSLSSISLPKGVTEGIKEYAFRYCGLRTVTLNIENDANAIISEGAFYACASLTNIRYATGTDANGATTYANNTLRAAIKSIGNYAFYDCVALTTINTGTGVTSIGNCAFMDCYNLNTLTIGTGVTTIGDFAFYNAPLKTRITYNAIDCTNNSNFQRKNTANIVIGNKVTKIPSYLFQYCDEVTTVTFSGTSVCTEIGDYAFYNCSSLTNIKDNGTNNKIPDSVKTIGKKAFDSCALTTINTGTGVTAIKAYAFDRCDALTTVTIGTGVTTIESGAFDDVPLVRVNFNAIDCTKANNAFANIDTIETIVIGNKVTQIPPLLFYNNTSATTVTFTATSVCKKIGLSAFYGCTKLTIKDGGTANRIPASVKEIEDYAFYDCDALTTLNLNSGVISLGENTFKGSTPLTTLTINSNIENTNAFKDHKGLTNLTLGSSCTIICDNMFENCTNLTRVDIGGTNITSIGDYAFCGCKSLNTKAAFDYTSFDASLTHVGKYAFRFAGLTPLGEVGLPTVDVFQSVSKVENYYPSSGGIGKVTMNISAESVQSENAKDYIVILDATDSMAKKINGKNKMETAKTALQTFTDTVMKENPNNRIAIVTFFALDKDGDGVKDGSQGYAYMDFTNDTSILTNKITELKVHSKGASLCSYGGVKTNYRCGLVAATQLLQMRAAPSSVTASGVTYGASGGADRNTYAIFISDGAANDEVSYVEPLGKVLKGCVDGIWSIGICVEESGETTEYLQKLHTSLNGKDLYIDFPSLNLETVMTEFLKQVVSISTASIYNTKLNSIVNTLLCDILPSSSAYPWSNGVTYVGNTVSIDLGEVSKTESYSYYVKLKDSYKNEMSSYAHYAIVTNRVYADYNISGGKYDGQKVTASNNTEHLLPWYTTQLTIKPNGGMWNNKKDNSYYRRSYGIIQNVQNPVREGYTFSGWTITGGGSITGSNYTYGTEDTVLTAEWKKIFTITYDGNGQTSGVMESQTFPEGSSETIKNNGFEKTEYEFIGWNTKADGTGVPYMEGDFYSENADLTLYAQWQLSKMDIPVKVVWEDFSNAYASRPASVTLVLMNGDKETDRIILEGTDADEWNYVFKEIEKYDSAGKEIRYSLVEAMTDSDGSIVKDYVPCLRKGLAYELDYGKDGLSVTNTIASAGRGVIVSGTVNWQDDNNKWLYRPDFVEIVLLQNGKEIDRKILEKGTTKYEFSDLDFFDGNKPYEYSVIEESIDNYETEYESKKESKSETDSAGNLIVTDSYIVNITNTFTPPEPVKPVKPSASATLQMRVVYENEDDIKALGLSKEDLRFTATLQEMTKVFTGENGVYDISYENTPTGNEVKAVLSDEYVAIIGLTPGKYKIDVSKDYLFHLVEILEKQPFNITLIKEDGEYYITMDCSAEESSSYIDVVLSAKRNGYSSRQYFNNLFAGR